MVERQVWGWVFAAVELGQQRQGDPSTTTTALLLVVGGVLGPFVFVCSHNCAMSTTNSQRRGACGRLRWQRQRQRQRSLLFVLLVWSLSACLIVVSDECGGRLDVSVAVGCNNGLFVVV